MNTVEPARAESPAGLNHLVIRVRDLEASHAFWTDCLGFTHVATGAPDPRYPGEQTRYYSGRRGGLLSHHDIALVEDPAVAIASPEQVVIDHIAVSYATTESWRKQLAFLESRQIPVSKPIRRGTTHSARVTDPNGYKIELVCDLPRELWESDINAAINTAPVALA